MKLGGSENLFFTAGADAFVPDIRLCIPFIVIVFQQGKGGNMFRSADRSELLQKIAKSFDFSKLPVVAIVIVQNSMPVNLCTVRCRAPPEEGDEISTVSN